MRRLVLVLLGALIFLGLSGLVVLVLSDGEEQPEIRVTDAVVTLPAVPGLPGAGYFTLSAMHGGAVLQSISSPRVERIELHETRSEGGMTRMAPIEQVLISIGGVRFEPGGKHAMLFGVDPALEVGQRVSLTFTFRGAAPVTVNAEVRGPGQAHASH